MQKNDFEIPLFSCIELDLSISGLIVIVSCGILVEIELAHLMSPIHREDRRLEQSDEASSNAVRHVNIECQKKCI
jgi:hypothetical protein